MNSDLDLDLDLFEQCYLSTYEINQIVWLITGITDELKKFENSNPALIVIIDILKILIRTPMKTHFERRELLKIIMKIDELTHEFGKCPLQDKHYDSAGEIETIICSALKSDKQQVVRQLNSSFLF